jgi:hypothetical protein
MSTISDYEKKYPIGTQTVVPHENKVQVNTYRGKKGWFISPPVHVNEVKRIKAEQKEKLNWDF